MAESMQSRLWRWLANLTPAYRRTGARISYIAQDFQEVRIRLPLNWKTRNHMNMIWGGALYAAIDPVYGVMLLKLLGPAYLVLDKSATIHFKRPGRSTLYARFVVDDAELALIRAQLADNPRLDRVYQVELTDQAGVVHATCEKIVHIRKRQP